MSTLIDGVSHVDREELFDLLHNDERKALIIDVRELDEYEEGHIPQVPLIPMGEIAAYVNEFDKDREYVFVCRSGKRSFEVARFFQSQGFEHVHNYYGGMLNWDKDIVSGPENVVEDFNAEQLERK
ncbi:rhodanese-related sulfurtransferase [Paenibacillus shirakamiensis]|uniref:Rhodanese-related sulfurtransferase n=1 Tax=Paenibacillus shirakamiensis TaxID=1265935 RepID=A0ABS4JG39_9BACL|nr:rhodanese-like domain-containing protein [Paenibacillus shirakamiensis]MBP2000678.1 rhodanese-related sulfurtransferase [Paenibacillus shirakamiensis]